MIFRSTPLPDLQLLELEPRGDARGFFARAFCKRELAAHGLDLEIAQANTSFSAQAGTLRGMHYQLPPHSETKIVRCIRGSIYDAALDLRPESPTFGKSWGQVLSAENRLALVIPKGFAHGFLTLENDSEVFYLVDEYYSPEWERGIRWDDPRFAVSWPRQPEVLSERDLAHPDFDPDWHLA